MDEGDRRAFHAYVREHSPALLRTAYLLTGSATEAETAAALGCSIGTVKSQTSRALAKLRTDTELMRDALMQEAVL